MSDIDISSNENNVSVVTQRVEAEIPTDGDTKVSIERRVDELAINQRLNQVTVVQIGLPGPPGPSGGGATWGEIEGDLTDQTDLQAALDTKQPTDADLTTIAAIDSSQSGVIASDGDGWIRKTYAQLKTALGLTKSDVGLGNVDNTSDANKPVSTAQQAALDTKQNTLPYTPEDVSNKDTDTALSANSDIKYPSQKAIKTYADTKLSKAANLSDLQSTSSARTNLGLGSFALLSSLAHSALTGLSSDDHTQYALLAGRSGGQTLIGGTASGNNLTLQSTAHATKGKILFGTSAYDEVNNRLGLGLTSPTTIIELSGQVAQTIQSARHTTSNTAGNNLTLKAGSATLSATNRGGGSLILSGGTATGTGTSQILLQAAGNGSSGTSDVSPTTRVTVAFAQTSLANRLSIGNTIATGTGFNMQPSAAVSANLTNDMTDSQTTMDFDTILQSDGVTPGFFPSIFPFVLYVGSERMLATSLQSGSLTSSGTLNVRRQFRDASGVNTTATPHTAGDVIQELRDSGYVITGSSGNGIFSTNVGNQSSAITIFLPPVGATDSVPAPTAGQFFLITDAGNAGLYPITVKDYYGGTILNDIIDIPFGSLLLQYDFAGARYKKIARENSSSATRAGKVGGLLFDHSSDVGSVGTTETDLHSDTFVPGVLSLAGDKARATYTGIFVNSASTKQLKAYFDGNVIFDSGALSTTDDVSWEIKLIVMITGGTSVKCAVTAILSGASIGQFAKYTELTGLSSISLNSKILKITGTSAGAAAADNDIVAKLSTVEWLSKA